MRRQDRHLALRLDRERFGEEVVLRRRNGNHDQRRRRAGIIELRDKGAEDGLCFVFLVVLWKKRVIAPVLASTEKEHLHAGLAALRMKGEDICFGDAAGINVLRSLNIGKRADAISQFRGALEIEFGGGFLHLRRQCFLDARAFAGQE